MRMTMTLFLLVLLFLSSMALENRDTLTRRPIYDQTNPNGFDNNFRVCVHAPLSLASTDQNADIFYENGQQQLLGYSLWAKHVNYEKKGIVVGAELWGIEMVIIEDFSDGDTVGENTEKCLAGDFGHMHWMFAPYSSGLTQVSLDKTENTSNILIAAGSNLETVWTTEINHGFTLYFAQGSGYTYSLPLYAGKSAKTIMGFCGYNSATNVSLCTSHDKAKLNTSAVSSGMTLVDYIGIDLNSSTYYEDIAKVIDVAHSLDVDVVMVNDYSALCIDMISHMRAVDWTPRGLYLVDCSDSQGTREAIGEPYLQYATSHTSFIANANYTSEITGYSPSHLDHLFKLYSGTEAGVMGAHAFAGGEIIQAAIETQVALDVSLATDPVTLSGIIKNGTWNTVLSRSNVTFGPSHIADYELSITQYTYDLEYVHVSESESEDAAGSGGVELVYPMPSWATRECERATSGCSGHGVCIDDTCLCEDHYYGSSGSLSCDTVCVGEIVKGVCRSNRNYFVGVHLDFSSSEFDELAAHLHLAVELVNNKTNGWMDDSLKQITIQLRLNDSACDADTSRIMLLDQEQWVKNVTNGTGALDGIIGSYCSASSQAIASHGARTALPQVSPSASSISLSNKEMYPYFTRTCSDNEDTSVALINLFEDLGLSPYIAIVYDTNSYAQDLSDTFMNGWIARGYEVLGLVSLSDYDHNYDNIVDVLASFGSPLILLCMYDSDVELILTAAQGHEILDSEAVIWAKTDWVVELDGGSAEESFEYPPGMISLKPHMAPSNASKRYISLWESLDPDLYHDSNGDRSDMSPTAGYLVDAVFALAQAYQFSINDNTGFEGEKLRQYVVTKLQDNIMFEGISGVIDFNIYGDQIYSAFDVLHYQMSGADGKWEEVGNLVKDVSSGDDFSRNLNYSQILWPDGTVGHTDSYSTQLGPYCPPGYAPDDRSGVMSCAACVVGTYKAYYGDSDCQACPTGADCNNIGIKVPCLLPGYWRDEPPEDALGDFSTHSIYSCDIKDACLGGCYLNSSCAGGRLHTSPTCGVCAVDYFQNAVGGCDECTNVQTSTSVTISYTIGLLFFVTAVIILFCLQIKNDANLAAAQQNSSFSNMFQQLRIHYRKLASTQQILISFLQILVGVQFYLKIDWPSQYAGMLDRFSLDIFESISSTNSCNDMDSSYYMTLMLWFIAPIAIMFVVGLSSLLVYFYFLSERMQGTKLTNKSQNAFNLWNLFVKLCLWVCLVFYPQLSYVMMTAFQCRDLGLTGNYLRVDYEINCETTTYQSYSYLAGIGVAIYSFGIPFCFTLCILYRHHPLLETGSELLYANYKKEYCYYGILQIILKFLLTSGLIFVSEPGQPSMALYLLVVDSFALILLALFCPYKSNSDNGLSILLVSAECCLFLVAFIILSGVSESDNYDETYMYSSLYAIIFVSIFILVPFSFALKFDSFSQSVQSALDYVLFIPKKSWNRTVERRSSKSFSSRRTSMQFFSTGMELESGGEEKKVSNERKTLELTENPMTSRKTDTLKK